MCAARYICSPQNCTYVHARYIRSQYEHAALGWDSPCIALTACLRSFAVPYASTAHAAAAPSCVCAMRSRLTPASVCTASSTADVGAADRYSAISLHADPSGHHPSVLRNLCDVARVTSPKSPPNIGSLVTVQWWPRMYRHLCDSCESTRPFSIMGMRCCDRLCSTCRFLTGSAAARTSLRDTGTLYCGHRTNCQDRHAKERHRQAAGLQLVWPPMPPL